ncbi:methyltransferase [Arcanobacterium pinnipediorum]|uniref:Methyltransferase n=1 Tax=Arcanobacterium pinnipediorum TaxID=1503041 RepID=A0ABY5AIP2_9ACTO|nr:methyltransferase [Arcanobacterium pinnipediorum]USR79306.1 methyltransferase [Arcanobacterium pinnipediorum]
MSFQFFDALRGDLRDYTPAKIAELIGDSALAALARDEAVPAQVAAQAAGGQLGLMLRLWWIGDPLSVEEVARAIPNTYRATGGMPGLGEIFTDDAGGVRSRFQLVPIGIGEELLWIASDRGSLQGARHKTDHVMGVGGATRTLAGLAHYEPGQRVLDLGTGCGIHAILAAKAGAVVVATDISARALAYARFNAALNEVDIQVREGSLFDPVAGEKFDVVVSNPPFVITPSQVRENLGTMEYRDAGVPGDTLAAQIVDAVEDYLSPVGSVYMLANWEISGGRQPLWDSHPRAWFAHSDLAALVVQREVIAVDQYIEMWLHDGGLRAGNADYAPAYRAWLEDFARRNVSHIGFGYLLAGSVAGGMESVPARKFFDLRGAPPQDMHSVIRTMGLVPNLDDETLSSLRLVNEGIEEHRYYHPGASDPWLISFTSNRTFSDQIQADTVLAGFVSVCDGQLTVGQIIEALAQVLEVDSGRLREDLLPQVVHMLELGMLEIVENAEDVD